MRIKIAILINNINNEEFQKYITNGQKDKNPFTFCMLDGKLLRIQVSAPSQESNTNQLEVKSISTANGDAGWKEEKGVKELFGFQKVKEQKEIEIFKSLGSKVKKLAGEKGELQTQLNEAEQKNKELEDAKKAAEEKDKQIKDTNYGLERE